ncbi:MAG: helix-turn-helix transcriptional regulator [Alphaproteobacteria bacterium]|nr:helix-turn-helix transcriptional regulator [Alphaproteobacteria bacterium]
MTLSSGLHPRPSEPIVHASAARHWRNLGHLQSRETAEETARPRLNLQVTSAFENFGDGVLTRREREVVRMVLRGHSSNAIGRQFQITTGTVKIHRKNIYAKLGISSQSELFSQFISYLSGIVEPGEAGR